MHYTPGPAPFYARRFANVKPEPPRFVAAS